LAAALPPPSAELPLTSAGDPPQLPLDLANASAPALFFLARAASRRTGVSLSTTVALLLASRAAPGQRRRLAARVARRRSVSRRRA